MSITKHILFAFFLIVLASCGKEDDPNTEVDETMMEEEDMTGGSSNTEGLLQLQLDGVNYSYTNLIVGGSPIGDATITAQKKLLDFVILSFPTDIEVGNHTVTNSFALPVSYRSGQTENYAWQANSGTFTISENDTANKIIKGSIAKATLFELTGFTKEIEISNCTFTIPY